MIITAVCTRRVKMFVRTTREIMSSSLREMFFKFAVHAHVSKFLAVIIYNDFNSLLYELRRSVEKMVNKKSLD